jgi:hypothetical protein
MSTSLNGDAELPGEEALSVTEHPFTLSQELDLALELAALKLIVDEAGGRFSDFSGRGAPDGGNGLSSNGLLHDEILTLLRRT